MNKIELRGCAPAPLIHYLKALGILRLVAEQFDKNVRGAWQGDYFVLETTKTKDELIEFFLEQYEPTPILGPWNGGSGFYDGDDTSGIDAILSSETPRLFAYREAIKQIFTFPELPSVSFLTLQNLLDRIQKAIDDAPNKEGKDVREWTKVIESTLIAHSNLPEEISLMDKTIDEIEKLKTLNKEISKQVANLLQPAKKLRTIVKRFERSKDVIIQACRNRLSEKCVEWIDATVVLSEKDAESPLLGSGGNDGRLDFTKAFMLHLKESLPNLKENDSKKAENQKTIFEKRLRAALFADCIAPTENELVGQFYPAGAGGANATQGVSANSLVNPWDFVLAIEGTLVLASAAVRRLQAGQRTKASFPFTVKNSKIGCGSLAESEDIKAEVWLPFWNRPASYSEISYIFREGRVEFSQTRKFVKTGFDFARAVAELGVDRGIESFERYAFTKRFGKNHFATPLGRFEVRMRPLASLIHQLDRWLDSFGRTINNKTPPRFVRLYRQIEEAIFELCATGQAEFLRETLIAVGRAEHEIGRGAGFRKKNEFIKPLEKLSLEWFWKCDDDSEEYKIAAALASLTGSSAREPFRVHLESVEFENGNFRWTENDAANVWSTASLSGNLARVLHRRSIDARINQQSHPPLASARVARLSSVNEFLQKNLDEDRIEDFLLGLSLLDWKIRKYEDEEREFKLPPTLPRAYALLKLLFLPSGELKLKPNAEAINIKHEPSIVPLLQAGRTDDALSVAFQRLRSSGLAPLTENFSTQTLDGARLAAALLVPVSQNSARALAKCVLRISEDEEN
jgi:CRISPR-associated protein Csx17